MDLLDALTALSGITAEQWGLLTTEQADHVGVDSHTLDTLARSGLLEATEAHVFRLSGAPLPPHLDIKVAWLQMNPDTPAWQRLDGTSGAISHSSACRLHGLGDLPIGTVEVFGDASRPAGPGVRVHLGLGPTPAQITVIDGLPVTTAARTVVDLLHAGQDGGHVGGVMADAMRLGLVQPHELAEQVSAFTRAYGLPTSASGHDLIRLLLADASESLQP